MAILQKERVEDLVAGSLEVHHAGVKGIRRFFAEGEEDFVVVIE